ncbi:cytochrome c biogenesis protein CcsA [Hyphobacterium sp. CCMP332]|nr:cytochrome c biogenesis protein CcsA [Hyphobacterium sp. CCMP332]
MGFFKRLDIKIITVLLMLYTIIGGFLMPVPKIPILNESIRNQYFHVSMWFSMMIVLIISVVYAIRYLSNGKKYNDILSLETANAGVILGILGIITGSIWAKFTWGAFWSGDPKQNGAAIALLIYLAYFVLRGSFTDPQQRARISAIYNIFAFSTLIPLLYILPRLTDSLHPGSGGNPGFNIYDLDNSMRMVFYPSIIGWTMLILWISSLRVRMTLLKEKIDDNY